MSLRMPLDAKGIVLRSLFSRWPVPRKINRGYTIVLPTPEDMPFLLRCALDGLRLVDLSHCLQILVVGDAMGRDRGKAIQEVVESCSDPRVAYIPFNYRDRLALRLMAKNGATLHWLMSVKGIEASEGTHVFLHDADAFFLESEGLERQYNECEEGKFFSLGVTRRWDPFFKNIGYSIPGTWEMMLATEWVRRYSPHQFKGRLYSTTHGPYDFDSMHWPHFHDYSSGRIGVMQHPPEFVHLSGTIVTYRAYVANAEKPVVDELFRLLFLSAIEQILLPKNGIKLLPTVNELASGLTDATRRIRYDTPNCVRNYSEFRDQITALCRAPIFNGERAALLESLMVPFDRHFEVQIEKMGENLGGPNHKFRRNGLAEN